MSKELQIIPPDGYEIDRDKSTLERIVFKEVKNVLTYDNIARKLFGEKDNFFIQGSFFKEIEKCNWSLDYCNNATIGSSKKQLESILALNKLCNVAKYLNGDWLPVFNSKQKYKYFIYYKAGSKEINIGTNEYWMQSSIYFKLPELARQAIEILGEDEIRKALTLNH